MRSIIQQDQFNLICEHDTAATTKTEAITPKSNSSYVYECPSKHNIMKNLPEKPQRNLSNISESLMMSDIRDDQKISHSEFEIKYEIEKSTANEKVI